VSSVLLEHYFPVDQVFPMFPPSYWSAVGLPVQHWSPHSPPPHPSIPIMRSDMFSKQNKLFV
jgi:hypothetical protein